MLIGLKSFVSVFNLLVRAQITCRSRKKSQQNVYQLSVTLTLSNGIPACVKEHFYTQNNWKRAELLF